MTILEAQEKVSRFISIFGIEVVTIEPEDALKALGAAHHYGIGTGHPAKLNLGDCFTYAVAMRYDEPILPGDAALAVSASALASRSSLFCALVVAFARLDQDQV